MLEVKEHFLGKDREDKEKELSPIVEDLLTLLSQKELTAENAYYAFGFARDKLASRVWDGQFA